MFLSVGQSTGQSVSMPNVRDIVQADGSDPVPSVVLAPPPRTPAQHLNWKWYTRITLSTTTTSTLSTTANTPTNVIQPQLTSTVQTPLTHSSSLFPSAAALAGVSSPATTSVEQLTSPYYVAPSPAVQPVNAASVTRSWAGLLNAFNGSTTSTKAPSIIILANTESAFSKTSEFTTTTLLATTFSTSSPVPSTISRTSLPPVLLMPQISRTILRIPSTTAAPFWVRPVATATTMMVVDTSSIDYRRSLDSASPLVSLGVAVIATQDPGELKLYRDYLANRLTDLYRLAVQKYNAIYDTTPTLASNFVPDNGTSDLQANFTALVLQMTSNSSATPGLNNVTVVFLVKNNNGSVLPASTVLARLNTLTDDEMAGALGASVLQRPTTSAALVVDDTWLTYPNGTAWNYTSFTVSPGFSNSAQSWSLIGAIVGISTVAIVLLSMALVWLIFFIHKRCTKKPTNTAQAPVIMTDNMQIITIPPPASRQPISVDHGMQTVVLPRRTILPSYESNQPNGHAKSHDESLPNNHRPQAPTPYSMMDLYGRETTTYSTQYSYAAQNSLPDRQAPDISPNVSSGASMSPPSPPKPPRMINEPQYAQSNGDRYRNGSSNRAISNEIASSTNGRVKLLSVVKTNRVEPGGSATVVPPNGEQVELQERPPRREQRLPKAQPIPERIRSVDGSSSEPKRQKSGLSVTDAQRRDQPRGDGNAERDRRDRSTRRTLTADHEPKQLDEPRRNLSRSPAATTAAALPYDQTVREIRREVRLWRRSQTSYAPYQGDR
ncbi:hypothetical protein BV898_13600 [Hypsibius exemplaris]|uniref:Uncharacterized protein n=1 Tax=Hypsibius exemplaris TaxID=2072580 RepID=A0A1W0WAA2_HYPEX|nr:hypothetical protein BV898_13600 [Hypsibius exemplaris]